jgi:hypothetical protein
MMDTPFQSIKAALILAMLCCMAPAFAGDNLQPRAQFPIDTMFYTGKVRVYMVEPESRWNDYSGRPYHFGFLDLAIDSSIAIQDSTTMHLTIPWNAAEAGYPGITESNIMAIATVFNSTPHTAYSDPPAGSPFTAYYTEAAASATPGNPGSNLADESQTHTVFMEEATATDCPDCPIASMALNSIYASGNYDFYYASMVMDQNSLAHNMMMNYSLYWWPTCYFDGGYQVLDDYWGQEIWYTNRIDSCRLRPVPDLDLDVALTWQGSDQVSIDVDISFIFNHAPTPPFLPVGPAKVLLNETNSYTSSGLDIDNNQLFFKWEWAEGVSGDWLGPYDCSAGVTADHAWAETGEYQVRCLSKDIYDGESAWSEPLAVSVIGFGDANGDGQCDVGDAVFLINYVFREGPAPNPVLAGDANCDAQVNVGDAVYIINYVFGEGAPPGCD